MYIYMYIYIYAFPLFRYPLLVGRRAASNNDRCHHPHRGYPPLLSSTRATFKAVVFEQY